MRIAAIVGGFPKLSETFILQHFTGLIDLGHEVDIYSRRRPTETSVQPDVTRYRLQERTHYFELPTSRTARVSRALRTFFANLPRHPLAMLRSVNPYRHRGLYTLLNNVMFVAPFLGKRYDAILCYWGGNGVDFIVLKDVFPRTRFVTRFGGDDYAIGDESGLEVLAALRERADAFIVQTDCYGRATLKRYGFDDRKIVTYRHVINVHHIPFRERVFDGSRVRILTVARLVEKKGIEFGIRAVAALREKNPQLRIEYRIVGDGPLREGLEALVRELGCQHTVTLVGAMTTPDVLRMMVDSDIYVLPSLMEQAGYVLLEAQATGLPVVATRVGGVPEMVRDGESAILVPPANTHALEDALQQLLKSGTAWPKMSVEGRRHVEEVHDAVCLKPRLVEILRG